MNTAELELQVEELEQLLGEIAEAADDPDLSDADARHEIRGLLADDDPDE